MCVYHIHICIQYIYVLYMYMYVYIIIYVYIQRYIYIQYPLASWIFKNPQSNYSKVSSGYHYLVGVQMTFIFFFILF